MTDDGPHVAVGTTVYNDDGERLGEIRGVERGGFFVTTEEGMEALSGDHERAGHEFGEGYLMWRFRTAGRWATSTRYRTPAPTAARPASTFITGPRTDRRSARRRRCEP